MNRQLITYKPGVGVQKNPTTSVGTQINKVPFTSFTVGGGNYGNKQ